MGKILIIGAGESGKAIAKQLLQHGKIVIGFIDDDAKKTISIKYVPYNTTHPIKNKATTNPNNSNGKTSRNLIKKIPLLGNSKDLPQIIATKKPKQLIVAVQNASQKLLKLVLSSVNTNYTHLYITPAFSENDFLENHTENNSSHPIKTIPLFRKLKAEDLIGRRELNFNHPLVAKNLKDKTAFITGAGGSIGSVLCLQLLMFGLKKIITISRSEHSIFRLREKIENKKNKNPHLKTEVIYHIGDVGDAHRLSEIFSFHNIELIFHAAAHKHVPIMEENPKEAFKNNVLATNTLLDAAKQNGIKNFVLISTDKAVNPSTVMGRSKRLAEMLTSCQNKKGNISCCIVRFGNVISSRGSVIPLFRRQIKKKIPITITHEKCERFFMTRSQAALLVLHAYALPKKPIQLSSKATKNTAIYMLDMGKPVLIKTLVEMMLQLYGFIGKKKRPIKTIGLRAGEKLYEDLLSENEVALPTECKEIIAIASSAPQPHFVNEVLKLAEKLPILSEEETKNAMLELLPKNDNTPTK